MKKRVVYYDILNVCAALGVIFLHCNSIAHTYSDTLAWKQALAVEVLLYWPVPVFFMLSGATLMGYRERYTTAEFFKKRFLRTVIPFVVWSLINAVVKNINPFETGFRVFINRFLNCSIESTYWFFIPLFSIYLAMPILTLLKDNRRILWYMAGGTFLLTSVMPYIFVYLNLKWNFALQMDMVGGSLLFAILGYLFSTEDLRPKTRRWIYALGGGVAVLRYVGTYLLSTWDGVINKTFFGYSSYLGVLLGVAVFVLFRYSPIVKWVESRPKLVAFIQQLSACSFGVYLIHMLTMNALSHVIPKNCWEWRLLVPFLVYALAVCVVYLLRKIPVIKHIVP